MEWWRSKKEGRKRESLWFIVVDSGRFSPSSGKERHRGEAKWRERTTILWRGTQTSSKLWWTIRRRWSWTAVLPWTARRYDRAALREVFSNRVICVNLYLEYISHKRSCLVSARPGDIFPPCSIKIASSSWRISAKNEKSIQNDLYCIEYKTCL